MHAALGIGALLERTKAASDTDPGTKSEPGMSDPRSATRCGVKQLPSVVSTGWAYSDNLDAGVNIYHRARYARAMADWRRQNAGTVTEIGATR